jgi:heat shock protein HslJ
VDRIAVCFPLAFVVSLADVGLKLFDRRERHMPRLPLPFLLLGLGLLSACAYDQGQVTQLPDRIPVGSGNNVLVDTNWRLVEFRSMDDRQGVRRPANRDAYTLRLAANGTASFRLDCNRATGSWSASSGSDGRSGSISFGTPAATMALCPPPSMGEALGRDIPNMRGFMLRDGRLFITLMADAGTYVWEPMPAM